MKSKFYPRLIQWNLPVTKLQGTRFFSVTGRCHLIHVLQVKLKILGTESFPLKAGFHYIQVLFKTGFTILHYNLGSWTRECENHCIMGAYSWRLSDMIFLLCFLWKCVPLPFLTSLLFSSFHTHTHTHTHTHLNTVCSFIYFSTTCFSCLCSAIMRQGHKYIIRKVCCGREICYGTDLFHSIIFGLYTCVSAWCWPNKNGRNML
jgi:hypothetical protein